MTPEIKTLLIAAGSVGFIHTVLGPVFLGGAGVDFLPVQKVLRYGHALAGATILLCGPAIEFLGL